MELAMLRKSSIFALALICGSATAQTPVPQINNLINPPTTPPPGAVTPPVTPGGNPNDSNKNEQAVYNSELCGLIASDNRGKITPRLKVMAHC